LFCRLYYPELDPFAGGFDGGFGVLTLTVQYFLGIANEYDPFFDRVFGKVITM
jgi:hypothetical protein